MKPGFRSILASVEEEALSKVAAKLPSWAGAGLEFPSRLSLEQCSSSQTASFKAGVASAIIGREGRIADLTGGLGSDSYAFSKVAEAVWYNEKDATLAAAVERNFAKLGVGRVVFNNFDIAPSGGGWLTSLRGFAPDLIFLDPARRSASGKKVFLLEDCSPDVSALLPSLLEIAPHIMVKLSPMADITMVCRRLDGRVCEVYAVGLGGECKELLCVIGRNRCETPLIHAVEIGKGEMVFSMEEEAAASVSYPACMEDIGGVLLEPVPAALKAGLRRLPCSRFGLTKLGRDTNLYVTSDDAEQAISSGLFKVFRILEVCGLDKKSCSTVSSRYPAADVSARGLPMTSEQLRRRLGVKDSSNGLHIFGVTADPAGALSHKILIFTQRV